MKVSRKAITESAMLIRPSTKMSEWAEQFAWIPGFRLRDMPHQAAMLDDPANGETIWMMASGLGKTVCLMVLTAFAIKHRKSVLIVNPTNEDACDFLEGNLLPTMEAMPCMKILQRRGNGLYFSGGSVRTIGADSANFGAAFENIFQDQIDLYDGNSDAADRAGWKAAWKVKCSRGSSRSKTLFERGDRQRYFLPCTCCGEFQWLKTEQLKFSFTAKEHARFHPGQSFAVANGFTWQSGNFAIRDTQRSIYVCEYCHRGWTDQQRMQAYWSGHADNPAVVVNGKELRAHWRPTMEFNGVRSRQLNGMYLTMGLKAGFASYLHQFAEDFLEAQSRPGGLDEWQNAFKCEA